jgi:hypothetical protein
MNINEIKKLAKQLGSVLIMNGEKPDVVIMDYDRYLLMLGELPSSEKTFVSAGLSTESTQGVPYNKQENQKTRLISSFSRESENVVEQPNQQLIDSLNKEIQALNEEIRLKEEGIMEL